MVFRLPLWKIMEWKSVGIFWHSQYDGKVVKFMFQNTNQKNDSFMRFAMVTSPEFMVIQSDFMVIVL
jgi:hypothetical protein